MKKITLKIVANNCRWDSWPEKMAQLKSWFSPKIDLVITVEHTKFPDIPFTPYGSEDPKQATLKNLFGINPTWYDQYISPRGIGYDVVLFVVNPEQWRAMNIARGWRADRTLGPVELQLTAKEKDTGLFSFLQLARHEIMHALFLLTGQPDTTHKWWDQGKLENALAEINFPEPNNAEIITLLQKLLEIIKKPTKIGNRIKDWALAIQKHEGYFAPGQNPLYPHGSKSWRNHNPGNFRYVGQYKAVGQDQTGFAIFPSYEVGFQHLCTILTNACTGKSKVYRPEMTLYGFFSVYAPNSDGNNAKAYAEAVAKDLGVQPTIQIADLL